jgi:hypothetical protein
MEYSVWTWRWTKESWEPFAIVAGHSSCRSMGCRAGMQEQSRGSAAASFLGKDVRLRDR